MSTELKAKADFKVFLWLVWYHLGLPEPTPLQYDIAEYLQNGLKRKVIEAFRGIGKSYITSAYVVWCLLKNPDENIMVVSASKDRSDAFARFTRLLVTDMPLLRHLRPRHGHGFDSVEKWTVGPAKPSQFPSMKSVGLYGQLTGFRADRIVADDVEVPNNSETQTQREKLRERVKEFAAILKPSPKEGVKILDPDIQPSKGSLEIIYLGTPQVEDSLYNVLPTRGYDVRVWPARYPATEVETKYVGELSPLLKQRMVEGAEVGTPTDTRFDDKDLIERQLEYGKSGFALQFMLDTSLSDAEKFPLRCSDLVLMDVDLDVGPEKVVWATGPERFLDIPCVGLSGDRFFSRMAVDQEHWQPYESRVMTIDPSGRGKDETSFAIGYLLNSQIFIKDCGGLRGNGYDIKTLTKLATIAKQNKVDVVMVEPNFGDGMFNQLFRPILHEVYEGCGLEETERSSHQKELRIIHSMEPVMNQHRLIFDKTMVRRDYSDFDETDAHYSVRRLIYQMTRITKDRGALVFDDRLDALAMLVRHYVASMTGDVQEQADEKRAGALEEELENFVNGLGILPDGSAIQPTQKTWVSDMIPKA